MATLPIDLPRRAPATPRRRRRSRLSRLALRLRVAAGHESLDAALARGADPRSRPELALRTAQLERMRHRRALARALRRTVVEATRARPSQHMPVELAREQIRADAVDLIALADRLAFPQPIDAVAGVAIAQRLITDGLASPLYVTCEPHTVRRLSRRALAELGPMD
jgi:hypothetical protein